MNNLVHADPLPAEPQNGQLTAVPDAIHAMAFVIFASTGDDVSHEDAQRIAIEAVRVLAAAKLPDDIERSSQHIFRGVLNALASPNDEGKAE